MFPTVFKPREIHNLITTGVIFSSKNAKYLIKRPLKCKDLLLFSV